MCVQTLSAVKDIKSCDSGSQLELEEIRSLYQKEALQRRLLYNQVRTTYSWCFFLKVRSPEVIYGLVNVLIEYEISKKRNRYWR